HQREADNVVLAANHTAKRLFQFCSSLGYASKGLGRHLFDSTIHYAADGVTYVMGKLLALGRSWPLALGLALRDTATAILADDLRTTLDRQTCDATCHAWKISISKKLRAKSQHESLRKLCGSSGQ